jgi:plastocyanin
MPPRTERRPVALILLIATLVAVGLPAVSRAATRQVSARDNFFTPQELHIDPGDSVGWTNGGSRVHTITSETDAFDSGRISPGGTFDRTFKKEGYFFYFCRLHGSPKSGMWGVVVVGDPTPPNRRPKVFVPDDYPTIQRAVNRAQPGSTVVVRPGIYKESVTVRTPDLVLRGVDRFRTILHGRDELSNGILIDGVPDVKIKDLTVRNFLQAGISANQADDYTVNRVDLIKNRTYGLNSVRSFDGLIKDVFAWGSGDSGLRVADCFTCSVIFRSVRVSHSFMGLSAQNATGVVVRRSRFTNNGSGIVMFSASPDPGGGRAAHLSGNIVRNNNNSTIPAAGISNTYGIPFGTGIWLAGVANTSVIGNVIENHERYGILITHSLDETMPPVNNAVTTNVLAGSGTYDLAWDGDGRDNCFQDNDFSGATGPTEIETTYPCSARPFDGAPFDPVQEDVAAAIGQGPNRDQSEPPEPRRPRCQKGRPGCNR